MTAPMVDPKVLTLKLSEGAREVLQQIERVTGKSPGTILAEGLSLAKLYEENRRVGGRLLIEHGGKTEEIIVP